MRNPARLLLVVFVSLILLLNNCNEDPTPSDYSHTIHSEASSPNGATLQFYDNGQIIKITGIQNNGYSYTFTTENTQETIDSIIGIADGYNKFKATNITVANDKTLNINLDENKTFWLYGENSTPNNATIEAFDDGENISTATITDGNYESSTTSLPQDNEVDSVRVSAPGFDNKVYTNVSVSEGANKLEANLQQTVININGQTIIIGKIADDRNYALNDQEYVQSRTQGNIPFFITNEDGSYYEELVSDGQGHFSVTIPNTGDYFYGILANNMTHPALIKIIADQKENGAVVAGLIKSHSTRDDKDIHMDYAIDIDGNLIPPPTGRPARTKQWKTELLEEGGLTHYIFTKIFDRDTYTWTDNELNQAQIDTILAVRAEIDPNLNKFYSNSNTIITTDDEDIERRGTTQIRGYTGYRPAGYIGIMEDWLPGTPVVHTNIGINMDYWQNGNTAVGSALVQESASVKAFGELQFPEEINTFDARNTLTYLTDAAKISLEWYQVRTEDIASRASKTDNDLEKTLNTGIWGGDIDDAAIREGKNNQHIQDYIAQNGSAEVQAALADELTKSATLKSASTGPTYTLKAFMPDGTTTTQIFTKENYQTELQQNEIPGFYKQEIEELFK